MLGLLLARVAVRCGQGPRGEGVVASLAVAVAVHSGGEVVEVVVRLAVVAMPITPMRTTGGAKFRRSKAALQPVVWRSQLRSGDQRLQDVGIWFPQR